MNKIRKKAPVCLYIALARLLKGSLRFPEKYMGPQVKDQDRNVFRMMKNRALTNSISMVEFENQKQ